MTIQVSTQGTFKHDDGQNSFSEIVVFSLTYGILKFPFLTDCLK